MLIHEGFVLNPRFFPLKTKTKLVGTKKRMIYSGQTIPVIEFINAVRATVALISEDRSALNEGGGLILAEGLRLAALHWCILARTLV